MYNESVELDTIEPALSLDNTKKELIEELDKKGIEYKSSMNKQELLNLL